MKIVFCLNEFGSRTYNLFLAKAAILSAKKYASKDVACIFDGENSYFKDFLAHNNIEIISPGPSFVLTALSLLHSSSDFWNKDYNKIINFATGSFMRFEIANLIDDDYCLYADIDTIFTEKFEFPDFKPKLMAMARQDFSNNSDFNTGVMLLNLNEFRYFHKELIQHVCKDLRWVENTYDQYVINTYCKHKVEDLDMTYNWRPHFGIHSNAKIIHFEKIKPLQTHAGIYESIRGTSSYKYYEKFFFNKLKEFKI